MPFWFRRQPKEKRRRFPETFAAALELEGHHHGREYHPWFHCLFTGSLCSYDIAIFSTENQLQNDQLQHSVSAVIVTIPFIAIIVIIVTIPCILVPVVAVVAPESHDYSALLESLRLTGPVFDRLTPTNVTAQVGSHAFLHCTVHHLMDKSVSDGRPIWWIRR